MITKILLPLLAAAGILAGAFTAFGYQFSMAPGRIALEKKSVPPSRPRELPPEQPSGLVNSIYGSGLVEAQRENVPIGSSVPGVVMEVFVDGRPGFDPPHRKVGDQIKRDEPLFRIDDRDLKAELRVREAALLAAEAQLHRLEHMPRLEDIPPAESAVEEARARLMDAEAAYTRDNLLFQKKMLAASDWDKDRYAMQAAKATLAKAEADLAKLKAGAWKEDIAVQRVAVEQARSQLESTRILLDRLIVRAPVDSEILQVNVRPGQFAAQTWKEPMVVLGELNRLHVRVDIDEIDLNRFYEGAPARATLRGRKSPQFQLEFVRVEPYVIPKRSLTGDNSERVDTRALQVLYALPETPPDGVSKVYVGQQMDVFLSISESPGHHVPASAYRVVNSSP